MITVWTEAAELDRWEVREYYISKGVPEVALELDEQISNTIARMEQFPKSARTGRIRGTREAIVGPYILTYRILQDCLF